MEIYFTGYGANELIDRGAYKLTLNLYDDTFEEELKIVDPIKQ